MATTVISGEINDSSGTALAGVQVTAVLRPRPAFETATGVELASILSTETDANGQYSFTLTRTADITPEESWYEIVERIPDRYGGPAKHIIQVGAVAASVYASRVQGNPPTPTQDTYLTQTAGDARYVLSPASYGGAGDIQPLGDAADAGVIDGYARIDHQHRAPNGTNAERLALSGNDLAEGLRFRETDGTDKLYEYRGGAWLQRVDDFIVADSTARNAIANPYEGMRVWQADVNWLYYYTGSAWKVWPGTRLGRDTRSSNYTANQSTYGTASNIFTNGVSWTADGGEYMVEIYCPRMTSGGAAGSEISVALGTHAGTFINNVFYTQTGDGTRSSGDGVYLRVPYTPSAGAAAVNARAFFVTAGNGTLYAGGGYQDMYIAVFAGDFA